MGLSGTYLRRALDRGGKPLYTQGHARPQRKCLPVAGAQAKELLLRNWQQYARKHDYNATRMIITFIIAICFGTLFQGQVQAWLVHT